MNSVAIIGLGNIGFRHFQAACATPRVGEIFIYDRRRDRLDFALAAPDARGKSVVALDSLESLTSRRPDFLVSAVTTDVQTTLFPDYLSASPRFILLEKPLGQSLVALDALRRTAGDHPGIRVNCARNLAAGWRRVREVFAGRRMHLEVTGNNWGFGCNLVHFTELFRFLTDARTIDAKSAAITPSLYPNKRGDQYEEFLGTAAFTNEKGDSLQVTCGANGSEPSGITLVVKDRSTDRTAFLIEERSRTLTDLETLTTGPLGDAFVSTSTRTIFEALMDGKSPAVPTLAEAAISHAAYFTALGLGLGRSDFKVT